jgi:phage antirepressor YoqD-like protein
VQKLYCDLGYPSLYKYLVKELGYGEGEASLRIAAVKLLALAPEITEKIKDKLEEGKMTLTHMGILNNALNSCEMEMTTGQVLNLVDEVSQKSTRGAEDFLQKTLNLAKPKYKQVILSERVLAKMERLAIVYGDRSEVELIEILLDEKLQIVDVKNDSTVNFKNSRYIPVKVKAFVQKRSGHQCEFTTDDNKRCDEKRNLNYEHIVPFAHGGENSFFNIKYLCQNHNQRERIKFNL